MNIWAALGFIALGAVISEMYNYRIWKKYKDGMENGVSLRYWKMGVEEEEGGNPSVNYVDSSLYTREPMGTRRRGTAAGASPRPTTRARARGSAKAVE